MHLICRLFFTDRSPSDIYTLSLHDALPILQSAATGDREMKFGIVLLPGSNCDHDAELDRKSTRLNSSHTVSSYAVFCLKKKIRSTPDQSRPCAKTSGGIRSLCKRRGRRGAP